MRKQLQQFQTACGEYFNTTALSQTKFILQCENFALGASKWLFHVAGIVAVAGLTAIIITLFLHPEVWYNITKEDLENCQNIQRWIHITIKFSTIISFGSFLIGGLFYVLFRIICGMNNWLHSTLKDAAGKIEIDNGNNISF